MRATSTVRFDKARLLYDINILHLSGRGREPRPSLLLGGVGAAGGVGSVSAQALAEGFDGAGWGVCWLLSAEGVRAVRRGR
jgi:hypothetical protein